MPLAQLLKLKPVVEPVVAEISTPLGVDGPDRATWLRASMAGTWREIVGLDGEGWRAAVVTALSLAGGAAVSTHFVAINAAVTAATGSAQMLAFRPAPGSVTTLRIVNGRLELVSLGQDLEETGRVL